MNEIIVKILDTLNVYYEDIAANKRSLKVSYGNLIEYLVSNSLGDTAILLNCSKRTLERYLTSIFISNPKPRGRAWKDHLLYILDMKVCTICTKIKVVSNFYINKDTLTISYRPACLCCEKERQHIYYLDNKHLFRGYDAKRRALKLHATVSWSNKEIIDKFYKDCPKGNEVDHIVPLVSNVVCGLHVENNLQYLTKEQNRIKRNIFIDD